MVRAILCLAVAALGDVRIQQLRTGWEKGQAAAAGQVLEVMVSMRSRNMELLEQEIMAVSDPRSPRYGQHLSREQVTELTAPDPKLVEKVATWLSASGVDARVQPRQDRFEFRASVASLEQLFTTKIHEYNHDGRRVLQAGDLHAPEDLAAAIRSVVGLHGTPYKRRGGDAENAEAKAKVTPTLLKSVYNVVGVNVSRSSKNRRATAEFQNQYTAQKDLSAFFDSYVDPAVFDVQKGDELYTCGPAGGCEPSAGQNGPGTEAMLDIEYLAAVAPGIKNEVWSYQAMAWCTDLKNWTSDLLDAESPPQVFSVSYGIQGNVSLDKNEGCSEEITMDIEEDFAKIAARGVSILVSSGDDGSGGVAWPIKGQLWPSWPASAPHVTAVGATMFINNDVTQPERATTQFGSGGGFDCRWPAQDWQKEATQDYLANPDAGLPRDQDYCKNGRGTPDLAALGEGYQVTLNGKTVTVGGTSASCPLVAGLISLLNEYRFQNGQPALGFLNPLLYQLAEAKTGYQDVTVGNNRIDRLSIQKLSEGYSCTEGWDAVTGFGTPNFGQMLDFVKQLPSKLAIV